MCRCGMCYMATACVKCCLPVPLSPPTVTLSLSRSFVGGVRDLHLAVEISFRAAAALLFSCNAEKAQLNLF